MANFRYDDDVLLKWEITGTGRCVGSYSHFNSMMRAEQMLKKVTMIGTRFYGANNSQVKYAGMLELWAGKGVGVEGRNTYTWGAEAGEVNEMKK
jgi:hypothetical protein